MSWGIDITGTKEGAKAKVRAQLAGIAKSYAGQPEADDVQSCCDRICALIDACDLSSDGYIDWNAVIVKANGSHGVSYGKHQQATPVGLTNASFSVQVTRTSLALDPPAPAPVPSTPPAAPAPAPTPAPASPTP